MKCPKPAFAIHRVSSGIVIRQFRMIAIQRDSEGNSDKTSAPSLISATAMDGNSYGSGDSEGQFAHQIPNPYLNHGHAQCAIDAVNLPIYIGYGIPHIGHSSLRTPNNGNIVPALSTSSSTVMFPTQPTGREVNVVTMQGDMYWKCDLSLTSSDGHEDERDQPDLMPRRIRFGSEGPSLTH